MPFIPRSRVGALVFLRYGVNGDYHSIANTVGNFPKIKIGGLAERVWSDFYIYIYGNRWRAPAAIVVFLLRSQILIHLAVHSFSRLRQGGTGTGEIHGGAYRIFWFRGAKRLSRFELARAPTTGLSAIYFFIIVVVIQLQRARQPKPRSVSATDQWARRHAVIPPRGPLRGRWLVISTDVHFPHTRVSSRFYVKYIAYTDKSL